MDSLVNLAEFRRINGLSQKDIAQFLGVSISFISRIEKNESKLPEEKIKKIIFDGSSKKGWVVDPLIPAYGRIDALRSTLYSRNHPDVCLDEYVPADFDYEYEKPVSSIKKSVIESIMYGRMGITDSIADSIIRENPTVSKKWLMTGEGEMFLDKQVFDSAGKIELLEKEIQELKKELLTLKKKVNEISANLDQK